MYQSVNTKGRNFDVGYSVSVYLYQSTLSLVKKHFCLIKIEFIWLQDYTKSVKNIKKQPPIAILRKRCSAPMV